MARIARFPAVGGAGDASQFDGKPASYYTNATNISQGVLGAVFGGTGHADIGADDILVGTVDGGFDALTLTQGANVSITKTDGKLTINSSAGGVAGIASTATGTVLQVTDTELVFHKSLVPSVANTLSLGSASKPLKDVFVSANTIHIGDTTTLSGTNISIEPDPNPTNLAQMPTLSASRLVAVPFTYNPGSGNVTLRPSIEFQDVSGNSYPISFNTVTNEFSLDAMGNHGTGALVAKKISLTNAGATALGLSGHMTHDGNYTNTAVGTTFRFDGNTTLGYDGNNSLTIKAATTFQGPVTFQNAPVIGDGNDNVVINSGASNSLVITSSTLNVLANGNTTVGGNLNITGNLTVNGTTTTINSNDVNIGDNIITLNSDIGLLDPTENAGIRIARGSEASVQWIWDETHDYWTPNGANMGNIGTMTVGTLNVTTLNGSVNAASATKLETARALALSGDVTGTVNFDGTANVSITTSLADRVATFAKMQAIGAARFLGRLTSGSGDIEALTSTQLRDALVSAGTGISINNAGQISIGQAVGTTSDVTFNSVTASLSGNAATATKLATTRTTAITGDVAGSSSFDGSTNLTINVALTDKAVTVGKIQDFAQNSFLGRLSAGSGSVEALTATQLRGALIGAGTGISIDAAGQISIAQAVGTSSDVVFNKVTANSLVGTLDGGGW